jgi:hypothetical protein
MTTESAKRTLEGIHGREVMDGPCGPGESFRRFFVPQKAGKGDDQMEETTFPEIVEQPVMWGYHRELHEARKHKAIVDATTGKLFSIVSKDYRLIRHEQAIDEIESLIYGNVELGKPTVMILWTPKKTLRQGLYNS